MGDALDPVAFAITLFAACAARDEIVTRPVAVKLPVNVGEAIVGVVSAGELDNTTEPVPVDVDAPVPPFSGASGFCSVNELNVGDGYVCASAGNASNAAESAVMSFFIYERTNKKPPGGGLY